MLARMLLLLGLFVAVAADGFEEDLGFIRLCNRTSPISLHTMNEVLINKKLNRSRAAENFPCFLHCLYTQYGWMDEDGGFELHSMRTVLEESGSISTPLLDYIMYTCTAVRTVDKCERAVLFTECFWSKTAEEDNNGEQEKFFYSLDDKK